MSKGDILKELIKETGMNYKQFSVKCKIPYTTLMNILTRGVENAGFLNIVKICRGLGITTTDLEEILCRAKQIEPPETNKTTAMAAAHYEGGEFTQDELDKIEEYKNLLKTARINNRK